MIAIEKHLSPCQRDSYFSEGLVLAYSGIIDHLLELAIFNLQAQSEFGLLNLLESASERFLNATWPVYKSRPYCIP